MTETPEIRCSLSLVEFVKMIKNGIFFVSNSGKYPQKREISSFRSPVTFMKIAKNGEMNSLLSAVKFVTMAKNGGISSTLSVKNLPKIER